MDAGGAFRLASGRVPRHSLSRQLYGDDQAPKPHGLSTNILTMRFQPRALSSSMVNADRRARRASGVAAAEYPPTSLLSAEPSFASRLLVRQSPHPPLHRGGWARLSDEQLEEDRHGRSEIEAEHPVVEPQLSFYDRQTVLIGGNHLDPACCLEPRMELARHACPLAPLSFLNVRRINSLGQSLSPARFLAQRSQATFVLNEVLLDNVAMGEPFAMTSTLATSPILTDGRC